LAGASDRLRMVVFDHGLVAVAVAVAVNDYVYGHACAY
jgi:hypothetical protein